MYYYTWLVNNKEWFFSGLGILILNLLYSLYVFKTKKKQDNNQSNKILLSGKNKSIQAAGDIHILSIDSENNRNGIFNTADYRSNKNRNFKIKITILGITLLVIDVAFGLISIHHILNQDFFENITTKKIGDLRHDDTNKRDNSIYTSKDKNSKKNNAHKRSITDTVENKVYDAGYNLDNVINNTNKFMYIPLWPYNISFGSHGKFRRLDILDVYEKSNYIKWKGKNSYLKFEYDFPINFKNLKKILIKIKENKNVQILSQFIIFTKDKRYFSNICLTEAFNIIQLTKSNFLSEDNTSNNDSDNLINWENISGFEIKIFSNKLVTLHLDYIHFYIDKKIIYYVDKTPIKKNDHKKTFAQNYKKEFGTHTDNNIEIEALKPIVLNAHSRRINSLMVNNKSNFFVSGSNDWSIKIWDLQTGKMLNQYLGSTAPVIKVIFDHSENYIFAYSSNKVLKKWDVFDNFELYSIQLQGYFLGIDSENKYILDLEYKYIERQTYLRLYNFSSGSLKIKYPVNGKVATLDDRKKYLITYENNRIFIYSLPHCKLVFFLNLKSLYDEDTTVYNILLEPNGNFIILNSVKNKNYITHIIEIVSGRILYTIHHGGNLQEMEVDPNSKYIVSGEENHVIIRSFEYKKELMRLKDHEESISEIEIDKTGHYLLSGSKDTTIKCWELSTGTMYYSTEPGNNLNIKSISIDKKGKYFISTSGKNIKVWDIFTGELLHLFKHDTNFINILLGYSEDCDTIMSSDENNSIHKWGIQSLAPNSKKMIINELTSTVMTIAVDPLHKYIFTGHNDYSVKMFNYEKGNLLKELEIHNDNINCLHVDSLGRNIFIGSKDYNISVWDLQTLENKMLFDSHYSPVTSIDAIDKEETVISGSNYGNIFLWHSDSGYVKDFWNAHQYSIISLRVDHTNKYFFTCAKDNLIKKWNLSSEQIYKIHNEAMVLSFDIDNIGKYLITGNENGIIKIFSQKDGCLLGTIYDFGKESIIITPDGYFDGIGNFYNYIFFQDEKLNVFSFESCYEKFHKPNMVRKSLLISN